MILYKNIFIFLLFLQLFHKSLLTDEPINEEARKILWRMLRILHDDLSRLNFEKIAKDCGREGQTDSREQGKKLITTFDLMAKKLKNPQDDVISSEVIDIFDQIDEYLGTVHAEQRQNVMKLEAYNNEFRLKKALSMEEKTECEVNVQKMLDNQQQENRPILQFISQNVLGNIRTKLKEIALFHFLTNENVQKKYREYFMTCYYKKEDLENKIIVAEEKANKLPKCGDGCVEVSAASLLVCSLCDFNSNYNLLSNVIREDSPCTDICKIFGCTICPVSWIAVVLCGYTAAVPYELFQAARRKLSSKKIEKIKKKVDQIDAEIGNQQKSERGKQLLLLENGGQRRREQLQIEYGHHQPRHVRERLPFKRGDGTS